MIEDRGTANCISIGNKVNATGYIRGNNNLIDIGDATYTTTLRIVVSGNDNAIRISRPLLLRDLCISIGNHVKADACQLSIGENFSCEFSCVILLQNSGGMMTVGPNCMFSSHITIRNGDSPHLIFDKSTGAYLDKPGHIKIGRHVWVGEGVYMTKRAIIPDDCIVGARGVVTKGFTDPNTIIAGNPARVVRTGVEWIRNPDFVRGTSYQDAYERHLAEIAAHVSDLLD
jgi:acetyltransferase-like isoleucine patch superfamily enzyme